MNKYKVYWFQKKSIDYLGTFETYENAKKFISWLKKMYGNTYLICPSMDLKIYTEENVTQIIGMKTSEKIFAKFGLMPEEN